MPVDPLSLATSATQFGIGALQSLIGGGKAKKAQRQLENLAVPSYGGSQSIMDYYNKALQRYNVNPYQSQQYQQAVQQAGRSTAAGINALQSRGSAVAGVGRLAALQNEQALKAGSMAETEQSRRFGALGDASQLKTADELRQFQQNEIAPYEKKYNLLSMKAGANNQTVNAGLSNMFGGLSSASQMGMLNSAYGNNSGGSGTSSSGSGGDNFSNDWLFKNRKRKY